MSNYRDEVIDPGDLLSKFGKEICYQSHGNCPAVKIIPYQPGNFRGAVDWRWKPHIYEAMLNEDMAEAVENDGAGGKPQFFTLLASKQAFRRLGWEIITMTADDLARSGRFPAIMLNQMDIKYVNARNYPLAAACLAGYGEALRASGLINLTGETAIMKNSITAFCDDLSDEQLILTWSGACIGLSHRTKKLDGSQIRPGMPIVGFWEPGYRCNGGGFFTKVIQAKFGRSAKIIMSDPEAVKFIRKLTVPSVSYARLVCRLLGWLPDGRAGATRNIIEGIAHITGGGVWKKLGDLLPEGVGADLYEMPKPAEVLLQGQELSWSTPQRMSDWEAYSTLHGGCGMMLVCGTEISAKRVIKEAGAAGVKAYRVGETYASDKGLIRIDSWFKEGGELRSDQPPEK